MRLKTLALKYLLPMVAAGFAMFALIHALAGQRAEPQTFPPVQPPGSPFGDTVAGAGMVEPSTEASGTGNIAIGSQLAGAITKVAVSIGQEVKTGELLFELDSRLTEADLKVREATVVVSETQVGVAQATLKTTRDQYQRAKKASESGVIAEQDYVSAEQAYLSAQALVAQATANVQQSRAQVEQTRTQLQMLQIRAPLDGTILQVNIRPGEYVSTMAGQSLLVMGNLRPFHVRVNVDEEDLPRLKLFSPARAKIRGDSGQEEIPLTFVRLEPFVVPKTSLTGVNTERVDTRVVQVIFAIDPENRMVKARKVLVGQIVDVFIDTKPIASPNSN